MSKINLEKGSFLPELKSVTSVKSVQMGAIFSRDWSPLHSDQKWAKEKGNLPDIILNNYTINGWISKYLTDLLGPDSRLKKPPGRRFETFHVSNTQLKLQTKILVYISEVAE